MGGNFKIVVQKYGGTSVGTVEKIKRVAARIIGSQRDGAKVVAVVSAMGHTTDELIDMASRITRHPPKREMDMLLATGEQVSIALLSMAIHAQGGDSISMTGLQSGIITDANYSDARIKEIKTDRILRHLKDGRIVIVAGFQGVSRQSEITTLGRGGSDTTAAALAAALGASACQIYTDVDGVYTADPNMVKDARCLDYISYEEMLELAGSGAQVLHPRAVEIAMKFNIPLYVRPSHSEAKGTEVAEGSKLEKAVVTGVTFNKNVAKIAIKKVPDRPGVAAMIFGALARAGINVRLIIQSVGEGRVTDISLVVEHRFVPEAVAVLERLRKKLQAQGIVYDAGVAEVSIVGSGIASTPGVAARMFRALARNKINIELISTSSIRVTCVIDEQRVEEAVRAIHKEFQLGSLKRRAIGR